jgi:hypothetical protein
VSFASGRVERVILFQEKVTKNTMLPQAEQGVAAIKRLI